MTTSITTSSGRGGLECVAPIPANDNNDHTKWILILMLLSPSVNKIHFVVIVVIIQCECYLETAFDLGHQKLPSTASDGPTTFKITSGLCKSSLFFVQGSN